MSFHDKENSELRIQKLMRQKYMYSFLIVKWYSSTKPLFAFKITYIKPLQMTFQCIDLHIVEKKYYIFFYHVLKKSIFGAFLGYCQTLLTFYLP